MGKWDQVWDAFIKSNIFPCMSLISIPFFHGCKYPLFKCIFHWKKKVLENKVSKFLFQGLFHRTILVQKFRTLFPKTFLAVTKIVCHCVGQKWNRFKTNLLILKSLWKLKSDSFLGYLGLMLALMKYNEFYYSYYSITLHTPTLNPF